jgi:hypothetical protein
LRQRADGAGDIFLALWAGAQLLESGMKKDAWPLIIA